VGLTKSDRRKAHHGHGDMDPKALVFLGIFMVQKIGMDINTIQLQTTGNTLKQL
jgi:hypothetical protein